MWFGVDLGLHIAAVGHNPCTFIYCTYSISTFYVFWVSHKSEVVNMVDSSQIGLFSQILNVFKIIIIILKELFWSYNMCPTLFIFRKKISKNQSSPYLGTVTIRSDCHRLPLRNQKLINNYIELETHAGRYFLGLLTPCTRHLTLMSCRLAKLSLTLDTHIRTHTQSRHRWFPASNMVVQ